jgi:restriction system protein
MMVRDTAHVTTYTCEVRHEGLNKYHVMRGKDREVLERKARALVARWNEIWQQKQAAEEKRRARDLQARSKEEKLALAELKTELAEKEIERLRDLLFHGITRKFESPWNRLWDATDFEKSMPSDPYLPLLPYIPDPVYPPAPKPPATPTIPKKPEPPDASEKVGREDLRFQPEVSMFDRIIPGRVKRKLDEAESSYLRELAAWEEKVLAYNEEVNAHNAYLLNLKRIHKEDKAAYRSARVEHDAECRRLDDEYRSAVAEAERSHQTELARIQAAHAKAVEQWEREKNEYYEDQAKRNSALEARRNAYLAAGETDVIEYCDVVLSESVYPDYLPQDFELDYVAQSRILVVDYALPKIEDLPSLKAVKYNQAQDKYVETRLSDTALNKLYEDVSFQIVLRTFFELFRADKAHALDAIVFNGYVSTVDKSTGQQIKPCIMSIQVAKAEFEAINLEQVEPKACFKKLKGVSAAKIHALAPVAPVAQISREDKRFIDSYAVAENLNDSVNLAAMDWEDFEHLIREVFEKEFAIGGGECKVTQASRDGGVDAVAFDPDPIRGGKIVIQAKRYTGVVGVSAVRDLWGTINHEGAMKGILVTTSQYGPDAYEFARGKPITLLCGGNLLSLLEKHGHRARIDIPEARKEMASRGKES